MTVFMHYSISPKYFKFQLMNWGENQLVCIGKTLFEQWTHHIYLNSVLTTQMGHFTFTFIATRRKLYRYLCSQMPCLVQSLSRRPNSLYKKSKLYIVQPTFTFQLGQHIWIRIGNPDPEPGRPKLFPKSWKFFELSCLESLNVLVGFRKTFILCLYKSWSGSEFCNSMELDPDEE